MRFNLYRIIGKILQVKIYPCFRDLSSLPESEFTTLCEEMRSLTKSTIGSIPEYQCLLQNYDNMHDKLLVIHRDACGKLDSFVSAVVIKSKYVGEIYHYGLVVVSPEGRRKNLPYRLAFASGLTYLLFQPLKLRYWITSLSSTLSILTTIAKSNSSVYPSPTCAKPQKMHLHIAKEFNEGVINRCYIAEESIFDDTTFIYKKANEHNCFKKDSTENKRCSANTELTAFYLSRINKNDGDAILQVGYVTYFTLIKNALTFIYRILIKKNINKLARIWRSYVYNQ